MYRVLDLFSGIGGFSLGLERTGGFKTVAFCEIEPFCRKVLKKHWPEVPIYEDVRELTAAKLSADGIAVDVICGGFPCQDISNAGKRAGIEGERSGLWKDYARLIGELRPKYVIVENVAALLGRGLDVVLGDLASLGFDAEWHCIPASAVGAPHRRDRVWIMANAMRDGHFRSGAANAAAYNQDRNVETPERAGGAITGQIISSGEILADTCGPRLSLTRSKPLRPDGIKGRRLLAANSWWDSEPNVGRVAHGVPSRVDRIKSLGNAVVPQIPELIGRAILQAEAA